MGPVPGQVQLLSHLSSRIQEHKAGCVVAAVVGANEPFTREHTPMRGNTASRHLEYLPSLGGVRPELTDLLGTRRLPLHGSPRLPTPPVQLPGRGSSCSVGPGTPTPMPESLAAGTRIPSAVFSPLSVPGKSAICLHHATTQGNGCGCR